MKSKESYFSLSGALIKENLRRFWTIPAVMFLAYFLGGVFPIIINYAPEDRMYMANYIDNIFMGQNPLFVVMGFAMPAIIAACCFQYMQRSAACTSMHSMPFSRAKIFNSEVISGLIMLLVPFLVSVLILLCIATPTYPSWAFGPDGSLDPTATDAVDVFTRGAILSWAGESIVVMLFMYALAAFAAMVSGTEVMQILLSYFFVVIAPALALTVVYFADRHLYGSCDDFEWIWNLMPYVKAAMDEPMGTVNIIAYIAVALAFIVLSAWLYQHRKLEKAGDAIVFRFMIPFLCNVIALFAMILMGVYFDDMLGINFGIYIGYFVGALLGYLITRMVVLKTPKVFNMQTLKGFCVYGVIAALIISCFVFDLTGFEKRIPANPDCVYTDVVQNSLVDGYDRYMADNFNLPEEDLSMRYGIDFVCYRTPENIEAVKTIHKYITENREIGDTSLSYTPDTPYDPATVRFEDASFTYFVKDKDIKRRYWVDYNSLAVRDALASIYESDEFKDIYSFNNLDCTKVFAVSYFNDFMQQEVNFTDKECEELLAAMERDYRARTFEQATDLANASFARLDLDLYYEYEEDGDSWTNDSYMNVILLKSDTETIAFLQAHGIADPGYADASQITYMDAFLDYNYMTSIRDKDLIQYVMDHGRRHNNGYAYNETLEFDLFIDYSSSRYSRGELDSLLENGDIEWDYYDSESTKMKDYMVESFYLSKSELPPELLERITSSENYNENL